jgi:hypothetical protein
MAIVLCFQDLALLYNTPLGTTSSLTGQHLVQQENLMLWDDFTTVEG